MSTNEMIIKTVKEKLDSLQFNINYTEKSIVESEATLKKYRDEHTALKAELEELEK